MPLEDFHHLYLAPDVWQTSNENALLPRTQAQIADVVKQRFPAATGVLLAGELVTNYYDEKSDLDVVVLVPPSKLKTYEEELPFVNERNLLPTEHFMYWYLLPDTVTVDMLVAKFGLLYDVIKGIWYGRKVPGLSQLARPEAILAYVNWQLFKYKKTLDLFPLTWTYVFAAFNSLEEKEKVQVIDDLKRRGFQIDQLVKKALKRSGKSELWKKVESFENQLLENEDEDLPLALSATGQIPTPLIWLVVQRFRYKNLAERLEETAIKDAEAREKEENLKDLPIDIMGY